MALPKVCLFLTSTFSLRITRHTTVQQLVFFYLVTMGWDFDVTLRLKKNLNASKLSEHPPGRIFDIVGQLSGGSIMRPHKAANYVPMTTLLDRTADTVFALQRRIHIREQESDLGARHLLQARRPAEHGLHRYYVKHNSEAPGHYHLLNLHYRCLS